MVVAAAVAAAAVAAAAARLCFQVWRVPAVVVAVRVAAFN